MVTPIQKPQMMRLLLDNSDRRGWFDGDVETIASALGMPAHDITHAIWDFQKQGWVTFRERHLTKGSVLTSIRLTSAGRHEFQARLALPNGQVLAMGKGVLLDEQPEPESPRAEAPDAPEEDDVTRTRTRTAEPVARATGAGPRFDPAAYPSVLAIASRRGTLEHAAELAEQGGADDLAVQLLEKAKEMTPLEAEAVALFNWALNADSTLRGVDRTR